MSEVHNVEFILLLLLVFVAGFAALARKVQTPYPIILVIAGLLLGFIPGLPAITLDPELIFLLILPPLVYSAAWVTSWRDFSHNLPTIAMLAIGLVGFTVLGVAVAGPWLFHGFDWRIGFVLGAAVATTDAIAATSIAKRIGLPKRIVDLLEGESLINDATGLLALEFAVAMVVDGQDPTLGFGFFRLIYLTAGGIGTGLIVAKLVEWLEHRVDDGKIEIVVSLLVPYAAHILAEAIHASGVLAVVAAGLYLGRRSSEFLTASVRLQTRAFWDSLTFILNGFVFVLIGLQLPSILSGVSEVSPGRLMIYGVLFSVFLIALRLVWTYPGVYVAHFIGAQLLRRHEQSPGWRQVFVVGWTGMRGVIALAAALSLPTTVADGSSFPHRNLIVFLTFCVILVTLVLQGLTLPQLIRTLGLAATSGEKRDADDARRLVLEEALVRLEGMRGSDTSGPSELYDDVALHYRLRLTNVSGQGEEAVDPGTGSYDQYLSLSRVLLGVERQTALRLWNEGRISDEVLREIEYELDLSETRISL